MKNIFKKITVKILGFTFIAVILINILTYSCEYLVEKHEIKSGKTILQSIGEEVGKAKRDFEKGYQNDSIK